MRDKNPIRTLGDNSRPSHEGYRNAIELPKGNNVLPLRSDTIRLVQNGCSFHGLRSEDPNQHLKDFLKLVDSLDLDGENRERTRLHLFQFSLRDQASNWLEPPPAGPISTWEDLTTRFLAQFFPPGRTAKLRNWQRGTLADLDIGSIRLVFVSENQDQMSTKNESEVGLAQGRTGVNDTREHVQELERECANMKYEILEVKMKRGHRIESTSIPFLSKFTLDGSLLSDNLHRKTLTFTGIFRFQRVALGLTSRIWLSLKWRAEATE
ncbi:zinc finger, CCHC-type containing protein [Tanacetum coccineum]